MTGASYEDILYGVDDGVATITLNRPDKLNAWTAAMENAMRCAIGEAAKDEGVKAVIITGAGRGFCAGADMAGLQKIDAKGDGRKRIVEKDDEVDVTFDGDLGPSVLEHFEGRFGYMFECPKPIIAAINGPVAGIGLVMTLFCDMRFASDAAKFTTAFAHRGLVAEHGIAWLLPRLIGSANALDILMSARKFTGDEAAGIGLVNRSYPGNALMGEVMDYAKALAETASPRSMTVMKRQVYKSLFQDFNVSTKMADKEMQASFASEDFKEGVAHFVEKRAANFTGH